MAYVFLYVIIRLLRKLLCIDILHFTFLATMTVEAYNSFNLTANLVFLFCVLLLEIAMANAFFVPIRTITLFARVTHV